ncbi:MAG: hypothetical protein CVV27_15850 [Candidatus Melainabacteria bacterium HGW-Melainabacteria-1]|nr:MAG: hypothetical protein CVV27_15850 [Candidatus Melainabacteria bacterium HGW-Melainabacteria-1]
MSRQIPRRQTAANHVSARLAKALGLESMTPGKDQLREALGLHQPPERVMRSLERFPDGLPAPRLPIWQNDEVTSPHALMFQEMASIHQLQTRQLRDNLSLKPIPSGWLEALHQLQGLYPDVPVLYNLEITYFRTLGNLESWRGSAEQMLERFPGYLFAACSLASYYLGKEQPDKVPPLFNDHFELEDFDPVERIYEASEISSFYGTMAWYHLFKRHILRSCVCISLIHAARPQDPFLDNLTGWLLLLPERTLASLQQALRSK